MKKLNVGYGELSDKKLRQIVSSEKIPVTSGGDTVDVRRTEVATFFKEQLGVSGDSLDDSQREIAHYLDLFLQSAIGCAVITSPKT